jgi:hypothetical protein
MHITSMLLESMVRINVMFSLVVQFPGGLLTAGSFLYQGKPVTVKHAPVAEL